MIAHGMTNSFVAEVLTGVHAPEDVFRMALYTQAARLSPDTLVYTTQGEVVGGGYGAGGMALTGYNVKRLGHVAVLDWNDPVWPMVTVQARGAMIYNYSKGNRAVAIIDFGKDVTSTNGNFTVTLPPPTADEALIQIAAGA